MQQLKSCFLLPQALDKTSSCLFLKQIIVLDLNFLENTISSSVWISPYLIILSSSNIFCNYCNENWNSSFSAMYLRKLLIASSTSVIFSVLLTVRESNLIMNHNNHNESSNPVLPNPTLQKPFYMVRCINIFSVVSPIWGQDFPNLLNIYEQKCGYDKFSLYIFCIISASLLPMKQFSYQLRSVNL